jgi:preprotein translocase subunit SecE
MSLLLQIIKETILVMAMLVIVGLLAYGAGVLRGEGM